MWGGLIDIWPCLVPSKMFKTLALQNLCEISHQSPRRSHLFKQDYLENMTPKLYVSSASDLPCASASASLLSCLPTFLPFYLPTSLLPSCLPAFLPPASQRHAFNLRPARSLRNFRILGPSKGRETTLPTTPSPSKGPMRALLGPQPSPLPSLQRHLSSATYNIRDEDSQNRHLAGIHNDCPAKWWTLTAPR